MNERHFGSGPATTRTPKIAKRTQFQGRSYNDLFPAALIVARRSTEEGKTRSRRDAVRPGVILTTRSKMRMIVQPSYCPSDRTTTSTSKPPENNRNDVPETRSQSTVACGQIRVTDETRDSGPQFCPHQIVATTGARITINVVANGYHSQFGDMNNAANFFLAPVASGVSARACCELPTSSHRSNQIDGVTFWT
jgi:hypothetical protein